MTLNHLGFVTDLYHRGRGEAGRGGFDTPHALSHSSPGESHQADEPVEVLTCFAVFMKL